VFQFHRSTTLFPKTC